MQKNPMADVKEAAQVLGLDERSVRERLINGQLKGEKKAHGLREKWFVYRGEIDAALVQKAKAQANSDSSSGHDAQFFGVEDVEDSEIVDAQSYTSSPPENNVSPESHSWLNAERETIKTIAEEMVKPLLETIKSQTVALIEKDRIIEEKDRQLRLLPDLQKQAEDEHKASELKVLEAEALKKQILAMEQLSAEKEAKETAIQEQLAGLTEQLHQLRQPWWKKIIRS